MTNKLSLRVKLMTVGLALTAIPLLIVAAFVYRQNDRMTAIAAEENMKLAYGDLNHIAEGVAAMVQSQQELLEQFIASALNVARNELANLGGVKLDQGGSEIAWKARNQLSGQALDTNLPRLLIGSQWSGQNEDSKAESILVDRVKALVGGACTIFQRMNEKGDMLRVLTNVQNPEGKRAIGTYIPATNPDGKPNPVLAAILRGERYVGRAFVVNAWYIAAYDPVFDQGRRVTGMLFVGVREDSATSLRRAIMQIKVGQTGYVYVLDSKGKYIISKDGKRDGESIWDAKDSSGRLFVQDIVKKALALKPGEVGDELYPWKNTEDKVPRLKVARIMYFAPWDWVIGVSSYQDEFLVSQQRLSAIGRANNLGILTVLAVVTLLAIAIWGLIARGLAGRLNVIAERLRSGANEILSASDQIAMSGQEMAQGANEQSAGLEGVSQALQEITTRSADVSTLTSGADQLMKQNIEKSGASLKSMVEMTQGMNQIESDSSEMGKIIKTIDEIAFQTNLLALNAAVEAARAGEAGKGFAVVAEEVRNLARRAAEAAKSTQEMLDGNVRRVSQTAKGIKGVNQNFEAIVETATVMGEKVDAITKSSKEVSIGIEQISNSTGELEKVVQQNAANAEESASAAEEMASQSREFNGIVAELVAIIRGGADGEESASRMDRTSRAPVAAGRQAIAPAAHRAKGAAAKPEEAIPLNQAKYKDF